jgi:hypothetical protein
MPVPQLPSPDVAMAEVLSHLGPFLPPDGLGVPPNQLGLVSTQVRNIALGHRRGSHYRAGQPISALTGLYLDATARIEVWGSTPDDVEAAMEAAHVNLLNATPHLRAVGFLSFAVHQIAPSQHEVSIPAWRKLGEFRLRYEYRAVAGDDADSFIVRIPVTSRVDDDLGGPPETLTVVDGMRRWDEEGAPALVVRGGGRAGVAVTGIASFDFRPGGFAGDGVTVERTVAGTLAAPTPYPTLAAFFAAAGDPVAPDRNARVSFATLSDLLAEIPTAGAPIALGDWDADASPDLFQPRRLDPAAPVRLATPRDIFAIRYAQPALAVPAIVYLRAHTVPTNSG